MSQTVFTKKIFYRFFFPAVISSLCLAVANLADALCVGISLGESALAAIGLVAPIWMVFNILDVGLAVGGAVAFTRLLGEGRAKQALNVFAQLLTCALLVSMAIGALGVIFLEHVLILLGTSPNQGMVYAMTRDYALRLFLSAPLYFLNLLFYNFVRCDDGERRAGIGLAVANLLDVGLSFVFVLGLGMGVRGAIYSTILGTAVGILIYLPHFFRKSNILSLRLVIPQASTVLPCFKTGFSSSSQYLWQFFLFLVINNLLIRRHGEGALAVFNVVINISYVVVGLFDGVGATIQPLAATFHAERNRTAEQQTMKLAFSWGAGLGVVLLAAVVLLAPKIAVVFGLSSALVTTGTAALRWYALSAVGAGASIMLAAYWQSVERDADTLRLTFLRTFVVYLLIAVPLALGSLDTFWLVFPITEGGSLLLLGLWKLFHSSKSLSFGSLDSLSIYQRLLREGSDELSSLMEDVEEFCVLQRASIAQTMLVNMALEETCQAIFLHEGGDHREGVYIQITLFSTEEGGFELHIRDNAPAFDPFSLRTVKISEAENEEYAMESIGILMVKKKAKEFYYRHYQGFNTLTVRI